MCKPRASPGPFHRGTPAFVDVVPVGVLEPSTQGEPSADPWGPVTALSVLPGSSLLEAAALGWAASKEEAHGSWLQRLQTLASRRCAGLRGAEHWGRSRWWSRAARLVVAGKQREEASGLGSGVPSRTLLSDLTSFTRPVPEGSTASGSCQGLHRGWATHAWGDVRSGPRHLLPLFLQSRGLVLPDAHLHLLDSGKPLCLGPSPLLLCPRNFPGVNPNPS